MIRKQPGLQTVPVKFSTLVKFDEMGRLLQGLRLIYYYLDWLGNANFNPCRADEASLARLPHHHLALAWRLPPTERQHYSTLYFVWSPAGVARSLSSLSPCTVIASFCTDTHFNYIYVLLVQQHSRSLRSSLAPPLFPAYHAFSLANQPTTAT